MGLFSKRQPPLTDVSGSRPAIGAFWQWWAKNAAPIAASVPSGGIVEYSGVMSRLVHAIDRGLAWEFGPGIHSAHQLTVTAEGDPALRRLAREWLRAAPASDETWSFYDMRQPATLNSVLGLGDAEVTLSDIQVGITRSGTGLDVTVFHPVFARLPETARRQLTYLALDTALGEEAVELWLDSIEPAVALPPESVPLSDLAPAVAAVAAEVAPNGEMGWTGMQGNGPQGPVLVTCLSRLSSVQAPQLDQHVAVAVPFHRDISENGLPSPATLDALHSFEHHLTEIIDGSGQLVANELVAGVRTLHYYVDSTTPAVGQLRVASAGWDQGRVSVTSTLDPSWNAVRRFGR